MTLDTSTARARALAQMATRLRRASRALRATRSPTVPLDHAQWTSVLADSGLAQEFTRLAAAFAQLAEHGSAQGAVISRRLRPAGQRFTETAERLADDLSVVGIFRTSDEGGAPAFQPLMNQMVEFLEQTAAWFEEGLGPDPPDSVPAYSVAVRERDGVRDPIAATFNVSSEELFDHSEAISDARLLGTYRERLPELTRRIQGCLSPVCGPPLEPFTVVAPLLDLLRCRRPWIGWEAARVGLRLIRLAESDPARLEGVLAELRGRGAARTASRRRLAQARQQRSNAATEADQSLAALSAYRILAEGQLRPWAWTLLRLLGADGTMPMLATLRDQLQAAGDPTLERAAFLITPEVRNADAHEEAFFDEIVGHIVVGGEGIEPGQIESAELQIDSMIAGFEVALACAVSQIAAAEAAYELRPRDPGSASEALQQAGQRYGHAGLRLWSIERNRGTVQVVLDGLPSLGYNPCFVATMQAHELVAGAQRWQISLRGDEQVVVDLSAQTIEASLPAFLQAAHWFDRMPTGTFLPCNTWARLAVELPGQALRSAAWLALNDVQDAIDRAEEAEALDVELFDRRLRNVMSAIAATLRLMPPRESGPLRQAQHAIRGLRFAIAGLASAPPLPVAVRQIRSERNLWAVPAGLPTLDCRPITTVEEEALQRATQTPPHRTQIVGRRSGAPLGGIWHAPGRTR